MVKEREVQEKTVMIKSSKKKEKKERSKENEQHDSYNDQKKNKTDDAFIRSKAKNLKRKAPNILDKTKIDYDSKNIEGAEKEHIISDDSRKKMKKRKKERQNVSGVGSKVHADEDCDPKKAKEGQKDMSAQGGSKAKDPKQKKKRRKREKKKAAENEENEENISAMDQAIEYLIKWKKDRTEWSFKKVRQVWLLQNLYDESKISKKHFKYLLQYMQDLRGKAREETLSKAKEITEKNEDGNVDSEMATQVSRAEKVVELLS